MSKNITADQGITIGLDLGNRHTQCCSLDDSGEVEEGASDPFFRARTGKPTRDPDTAIQSRRELSRRSTIAPPSHDPAPSTMSRKERETIERSKGHSRSDLMNAWY